MNKRSQPFQGGSDRYGDTDSGNQGDMADKPQRATAAQMARRTIAAARKPSGSQRSSRAGTPTAFGPPAQQSMPSSFQPANQSGTGFGSDFNFSVDAPSNPFAHTNGASSTPPPAPFQFGAMSNPPQQNGGSGGSLFGNNSTSFGSTFDSSSAQPQQNGFNPSTTLFGQNDSNKTAAPSFTFGQSTFNQPQQNGLTSGNSFPSFGKPNNDNPFSFQSQSQSQTQSTANTSLGSFGQTPQQNGDKAPSTPFTFGQTSTNAPSTASKSLFGTSSQAEQTPKTTTSSIFASFNQQNGDKPLFPAASQSEQTPTLGTSNVFGAQPSTPKPLFGATPPPEAASQPSKPGESIFNAFNQQKKDGITAGMFTQSRDQTPQPSTSNIFGAPAQSSQQSDTDTDTAAKTSNTLSGSTPAQTNGVKGGLFGGISTTQSEQQTPKSSTGLFNFGQQTSQPPATPAFKFGQSQQDTSMTTPGNTPQKQIEAAPQHQASASETASSVPSAPPAASLFTPRTDAPPTTPKPSFTPSTSMFNAAPTTNSSVGAESQKTPVAPSGGLFDRVTPADPPPTAFKPTFTPSTASQPDKPSDRTAAPWISHAPAFANEMATSKPAAASVPAQRAETAASSTDTIPAAERQSLKALNEGLLSHLATQNRDADWTPILQYCIQEAAKILKKPEPKFDTSAAAAPNATQQKSASQNVFAASSSTSQASDKSGPASQNTLFASSATPKAPAPTVQQTPKPSNASSLLKPPQTAPVNRKRAAEEEAEKPPATEKRARSKEPTEYPKLPENASETAKLFQAALDKSSNSTPAALKSAAETKEKEQQAPPATTFGGFKPSTAGFTPSTDASEKEKQAPSAPTFGGFKPSTAGFTPTTSGMPTFSAPSGGSGGFLAAFGKKASAEEEKERKKRKANDYDSDEETEEAWAERDRAEQQAKRQKILDAAKSGSGFTPSGSNATTPAPESDFGEGSDKASERGDDTDVETPPLPSKSLFDRVTPRDPPATATKANSFAPKTPSLLGAGSTTPDLFGHLSKPRESIEVSDEDKTSGEKEQGEGDHTWKPDTPIKFGGNNSTAAVSTTPAAPPPPFGNLFGTTTPKPNTDGTGHLSIPKPFHGFQFGNTPSSLATSRASTPGFTTDGEGASTAGEGEEDEDNNTTAAQTSEPQVEDQTDLRESEKEDEDLLFSVHMAKAMRFGEKKNAKGDMDVGWNDRGKGPLYILKHKESGKVRVVLKVPPYGDARMNFEPLKNMEYSVKGGGGKMVQGIFVDHLDLKNPGALSKWLIQVGKAEDAKEMARVLMENRAS